jgi:hypothetical protein
VVRRKKIQIATTFQQPAGDLKVLLRERYKILPFGNAFHRCRMQQQLRYAPKFPTDAPGKQFSPLTTYLWYKRVAVAYKHYYFFIKQRLREISAKN